MNKQVTDPVELADVLLTKTNLILGHMEQEWRQLLSKTNSIEPNVVENGGSAVPGLSINRKTHENGMEEIQRELQSYEQLTGRTLGKAEVKNASDNRNNLAVDDSAPAVKSHKGKDAQGSPARSQEERYSAGSSPSTRIGSKEKPELKPSNTDRTERKSQKHNAWKADLTNKIKQLEDELEEMRILHLNRAAGLATIRNGGIENNMLLLDIVSSQSSSPVKNPSLRAMGRTFRKIDVSPNKSSVGSRTGNVKDKLVETEQIMERGFRTARELNHKMDILMRKPNKKTKDAALQVSMPEKEVEGSENESYIRGLAENVTTMLLQQSPLQRDLDPPSERHHMEETPRRTPRVNARHLVVTGHDAKTAVPSRLAVQRLPDNSIRGALTLQPLPSIHIPPTAHPAATSPANVKVYVVNHSPTPAPSPRHSIQTILRNVEAIEEKVGPVRAEIGVQAQLSETSQLSLEKRLEFLATKFRKENKLLNGFDPTEKLNDLLRKVEASGEMCQRFARPSSRLRNPPAKTKLLNSPDNESDSLAHLMASPVKPNSPSNASHIQSDDYQSDFEVESLRLDAKKSISGSKPDMLVDLTVASQVVAPNHRFQVTVVPSTPRSPLQTPATALSLSKSKLSPSSCSLSGSKDESLIEDQMKRLGLSPERSAANRRRKSSPRPKSGESYKESMKELRKGSSGMNRVKESQLSHRTYYVKSDGKFIPVEPLQSPKVSIIVPEIVVKLPETLNRPLPLEASHYRAAPPQAVKQDQVIQTDEGCGTLTSGEASSVVEKLNKHFERTQLLLERIGGTSTDRSARPDVVLHRRAASGSRPLEKSMASWGSPGEINPLMPRRSRTERSSPPCQSSTSRSEGEVLGDEDFNGSRSQSIGEASKTNVKDATLDR